jgi:hypothetical protein
VTCELFGRGGKSVLIIVAEGDDAVEDADTILSLSVRGEGVLREERRVDAEVGDYVGRGRAEGVNAGAEACKRRRDADSQRFGVRDDRPRTRGHKSARLRSARCQIWAPVAW